MGKEEPAVGVAIGDRVGKDIGDGVGVADAAARDLVGPPVVDSAGVRGYRDRTLDGTQIHTRGRRSGNHGPDGGAWGGRPSHNGL